MSLSLTHGTAPRALLAALAFFVWAPYAVAQEPSADHLRAAEEFLEHLHTRAVIEATIDSTLASQLRANPDLAPYEDVMRAFLRKYMGWHRLKGPMARIYAQAFTAEELRELTAFYRTETGRKAALLGPTLVVRGMALGEAAVEGHLPELEKLMRARDRELYGAD